MTADGSIYLDYAAATPVDTSVLESMLPYFSQDFANPSASYGAARRVRAAVDDARARIAHLMGAKPAQITFTAGATEANNLALTAAGAHAHVLASAIEHDSIRACVGARDECTATGERLADASARQRQDAAAAEDSGVVDADEHSGRGGSSIPVTATGIVTPDALRAALRPDTEFVSIALANGEIGTVQPLRELAAVIDEERARRLKAGDMRPLYLHTDASQAAAFKSLNVSSLGVDLITVSAAKMYGPKQVGLLWARSGVALHALTCGGGQENGLRSGTENVPGIIGFARAFELARAEQKDEARRLRELRDWLQRELVGAFDWAVVSGPTKDAHRLDNLLHVSFPGLEARRLVILLDQRGVSVGTGAACAASKMTTSHVLEAIGASPEVAAGSLRITMGRPTTREQVERAATIIEDVVREECQRIGKM